MADSSNQSKTLSVADQQALSLLLFGTDPNPLDVQRWRTQGFNFCEQLDLRFGLKQLYGGPCGILAPVQAFMMKILLFDKKCASPQVDKVVACSDEVILDALLSSLAHIIFRSNRGASSYVLVHGDSGDTLQSEVVRGGENDIKEWFARHTKCLQSAIGVLAFVYSVCLTRGVDTVKSDMDSPLLGLVGQFGHCSQDLVNLMMIGRAVTNVFNGVKRLGGDGSNDGFLIKGIEEQSEVGFLTLLEHLRYSKVGEFYKNPKVPVWVIGSSSHYTVLFAKDPLVGHKNKEDVLSENAKRAFEDLDPEENGFIPMDSLPLILTALNIPHLLQDAKGVVDPERMGIVLWTNLKAFLQSASKAEMAKWNCSACTFLNEEASNACDMCATAKPQQPPQERAEATGVVAPKQFDLYHFNGIDGHGKAQAECSRAVVRVLDEDVQSPPSRAQGLKEVIKTRWTSAVIDYAKPTEPKI